MDEPRGTCAVCDESVAVAELADHFRLMHPDVEFEIPTWPDGQVAIIDTTLTADVFGIGDTGCSCGVLTMGLTSGPAGASAAMQCPSCGEWVESVA